MVPYRSTWPEEYQRFAGILASTLGETTAVIDHVGSTSVPGLAAKDMIDVQIQARSADFDVVRLQLTSLGLRQRPEPWNSSEHSAAGPSPKMVFAPPIGSRPANVHVRAGGSPAARTALLFRDYLTADTSDRENWSCFKRRLAEEVVDLASYGQIKAHPWAILMRSAERWASVTGWRPEFVVDAD